MTEPLPMPSDVEEELRGFSPLVRRLLFNRGVQDCASAEKFLSPDYGEHTHDPFLMPGMELAVERILKAIADNEHIVIYSDYDTDGIPGAVVLADFLRKIGYSKYEVYIPHRILEGFGLNMDAIDEFIRGKADLLITIDCGIRGIEEVKKAQENGIDVIITDHHLPGDEVPEAYAIVNPKVHDSQYPDKELCGAGVIYKVVQGLVEKGDFDIPEGWEKWLLDMVGIATVSDMVPLVGENRVFAHYGLLVLRKSSRPGLVHLLRKVRAKQKKLTEDDIGFLIGPRINAASRMGVPDDAFRLLYTTDEKEGGMLAEHLHHVNDQRKAAVAVMTKEANKKMSERDERPVIVIGNPEWQPSLAGLVANSLSERHRKPAFVWGRGEGSVLKGSCRSEGKTHLVRLMDAAPVGTFLEYGGHAASGGFSISHEGIHTLDDVLNKSFEGIDWSEADDVVHTIDADLTLADITWDMHKEVHTLAPFGIGNQKPLFRFDTVQVVSARTFGKSNNHLKLLLDDGSGTRIEAIEFFKTPAYYSISDGDVVTIYAHLDINDFGYKPELRLRVVDVKK